MCSHEKYISTLSMPHPSAHTQSTPLRQDSVFSLGSDYLHRMLRHFVCPIRLRQRRRCQAEAWHLLTPIQKQRVSYRKEIQAKQTALGSAMQQAFLSISHSPLQGLLDRQKPSSPAPQRSQTTYLYQSDTPRLYLDFHQ